ncbi:MAG: pentapeptide repeat-containing protein, partial [Alphaproteobacteria bacterium]|nr:pentapeptide repeat-containing protein [Alphaproteobacteria bacterium]
MTLQDELEHKDQWTKVSQQDLDVALDRHEAYVNGKRDGERMQMSMHDLSYLDMAGRNLSRSELTGSVLTHANLEGAILDDAILFASDLRFT